MNEIVIIILIRKEVIILKENIDWEWVFIVARGAVFIFLQKFYFKIAESDKKITMRIVLLIYLSIIIYLPIFIKLVYLFVYRIFYF